MAPVYLVKRLLLACAFRCWPWNVPWEAVKYLHWPPRMTDEDIRRTRELAQKYGWV